MLHEILEKFAKDHSLERAVLWSIGGADQGSQLVTGPWDGSRRGITPDTPMHSFVLDGIHESAGVGSIFPDEKGEPVLHLHLACGRDNRAITGCARNGVVVWLYMEVVIMELKGLTSLRSTDPSTGFKLLSP